MAGRSQTRGESVDAPAREGEARERIIDAARRLFAMRGYRGTPTKEIAVHAGVATGSVFYHFSSKEELLKAVVSERLFSSQIPSVMSEQHDDVRSTLRALAETWVGGLDDRAEMLSILVNARLETPDAFETAQSSLLAGLDVIADYLRVQLQVAEHAAWVAAHSLLSSVLVGAVVIPSATVESGRDWIGEIVDGLLEGLLPR